MITIVLKNDMLTNTLHQSLKDTLDQLHPEDAPQICKHNCAGRGLIVCHLSENDSCRSVQIYYIASSLTDFIVTHYEPALLIRLIDKDHSSQTKEEQIAILAETLSILQGNSPLKLANEARLQSKASIMYALLDYLNGEDLLILDGFVCFRLWEYRHYLYHIARMAAESVRRERSYREFITLLRSFVELQEPRVDVVHVIIRPNGHYRVLNRNYDIVENEYLEGFAGNLAQHDLDLEDLLISALLAIAPFRIILHFPREWSPTDAIQSIFRDRANYCLGCHQCEKSRKAIAKVVADRARRT